MNVEPLAGCEVAAEQNIADEGPPLNAQRSALEAGRSTLVVPRRILPALTAAKRAERSRTLIRPPRPAYFIMVDKPSSSAAQSNTATPGTHKSGAPSARRGPDVRDAVAELAERAQLISQEAGTKVAAAMKDVISAGAGIAGFAIESARDLVNYMVRRGQMTQEEGDSLIRDAEAAHERRPASEKSRPTASTIASEKAAAQKAEAAARAAAAAAAAPPFRGARAIIPPAGADNGSRQQPAAKAPPAVAKSSAPAAKKALSKTAPKAAAKTAGKTAAKAPAAKAPAAKAPAAKVAAKLSAKSQSKVAKSSKPSAKRGKK